MSDDMSPAFELDDTPEESVDSSAEFGSADDFPGDALGMAEFDGPFAGSDSDDSTDPEIDSGSGDPDNYLTSAMGDQSFDTEEPAAEGDSAPDSSESSAKPEAADDTPDDAPSQEDVSKDHPAGEDTSSNQDTSSGQSPASTGEDGGGSPSAEAKSSDLTVSIDGEDIVVGEPTLDITGDGVADTVVVENEGNVEYYVDTDQDGVADQIIVLDENDGTLVNHEVFDPGAGTWTNVTGDSAGSD